MKIALVHDHLMQAGGAERVLSAMSKIYPEAPIFTLLANKAVAEKLVELKNIRTSYLQKLPLVKYYYRALLPFMPHAIESFDLSEYDVVLSSASSFAKGVKLNTDATHICYCHTPTRYLWLNQKEYIESLPYPKIFKKLIKGFLPYLSRWDKEAAGRVHVFIANSNEVAGRIKSIYNRDSVVVYPPRTLNMVQPMAREKFFLTGGRLVAYKRFDTAVEAFTRLKLPLLIFGEGPDMKRLKKKAGRNIKFLGKISDEKLSELYTTAKAFIHPQYEDFGITVTEAMSAGCPVIAFNKGGAAESIVDNKTGVLYDEQSWPALADAVVRFESNQFYEKEIIERGQSFSYEKFADEIQNIVAMSHESINRR